MNDICILRLWTFKNADHKGRRIECCLGKRYFVTYKLPFTLSIISHLAECDK